MSGKGRRALCRGIMGVVLAAALVVQPVTTTLLSANIVFAAEEKTELIKNGSFSDVDARGNSAENWEARTEGATKAFFEQGKAVFDIQTMGADWSNYLKYTPGIDLKNGQSYDITFNVKSSVDRIVQYGFDGGRLDIRKTAVKAGEETRVSYTYTANQDYNGNPYMFYLGNIDNETNPTKEHTVEISDFSVKASGESGQQGGGTTEPTETETTETESSETESTETEKPGSGADEEDGETIKEVAGNLLINGNFEKKQEGWTSYSDNADIYWNQYLTVFQIKDNAADWGQSLVQNVELEAGVTYEVSFDVESTVSRTVAAGFDNSGRDEFHSDMIPANTKTTLSYRTTKAAQGSNKFMIYLGTNVGAHKVVISNVSIVEVPEELPDTENDKAPKALTSLKGLDAADGIALKDGNFTDGLNQWEHWEVDWMQQWNVVKYAPVENGMSVYIKNVGGGDGNHAWDVQLNQHVDLKKDLQYTLSFDVHTEKARAINVTLQELGTGEYVKTIGLQKDETRHVILNIPVQSEDALNKLFSIQMGKVTGDVQDNTLTFSNMKMEVHGYEALAVQIPDGDFSEGMGKFAVHAGDGVTYSIANKSLQVELSEETKAEDVTLERKGLKLEEGVSYQLSFVAGAVSGKRNMKVELPNGESRDFSLTDDATLYTAEFTADQDINGGALEFLLGGKADTICLDTIRLDVKGYADATGMNLNKHEIASLTKNVAPVISEDAQAVAGKDVVLTFVDADGAYTKEINGVKVNGTEVAKDQYKVEQGKITLNQALFTVPEKKGKENFAIEINAHWYNTNHVNQIVYEKQQWKLTWEDDFNENSLDLTKWSYQEGTGAEYGLDGWGNNEQQYYTRDNLKLEDGELVITATGDQRSGKPYSSARIWTMNDDKKTAKFSQTYGRFEAKMKLPAGEGCQGLWPAFWLLPVESYYGAWPLSGEIDIMEARGREGNKADGTIHFGRPWPNDGSAGDSYVWEDDALAITDYHIYSVDWTPTYMSFQVDGVEYYRTENWYSQDDNNPQKFAFPAPFDQEFYIVLNMAVGGTYDGNRNPSADALPAEMKVDYVRVYEAADKNSDDYIAPEPEVKADPIPAGAKTELIDPEFKDVKKVVTDSDEKNVDGWNLLTLAAYGGAADFTTTKIDGDTFAKINITNSGSQTYSVQLTQKLSLSEGHWYTLGFDAKADAAREIIAKIGGDGTNSWSAYHSTTAKLGKDVKHYEYTFQMLNKTDTSSRLEMNMGGGSKASVYLSNITFEEADGLQINYDVKKSPLENGNHLYNGQFNLGDVSRMAYWHTSDPAGKVVKEGNEYVFQSAGASNLSQNGVELLQSDTYRLTFDAKAPSEQQIKVAISDKNGNIYAEKALTAGTEKTACEFTFTMPEGVTDKNGVVTVAFAGAGVKVDNFVLTRETYNNVDYSGLNCYPLTNGDFELGTEGWSTYGTTLSLANENGTQTGRVNGTTSANRWDALLSHDTMHLTGGYTYELSFDAKADKDATIDISMEDASYSRYFQQANVAVGTAWKNYSYTFKLSSDADLALKFLTGAAKEAYTLDIDHVVLKIKGAPGKPGDLLAASYNRLGEDVEIAVNGTENWKDQAEIFLDDKKLNKNQYHFDGKKLILEAGLFSESREYSMYVMADGYSDTAKVTFKMYPKNGDLICNGDFAFGQTAWGQYIHGGDSAQLKYSRGYVAGKYLHAEGDEWGNPSVPWSIQLTQKVNVAEAGNYDISFVAFSEVERYFMVGFAGGEVKKVKIGTKPEEYMVTLNVNAPGTYELQLFMGTVNPDAENGYFAADGFTDYEAHHFYVDSISMLPEGTEVSKTDSELYQPIKPEETENPEQPDNPDQPKNPEQPDNTDNPGTPEQPGNSDKTNNSDQSQNSAQSGNAGQNANTAQQDSTGQTTDIERQADQNVLTVPEPQMQTGLNVQSGQVTGRVHIAAAGAGESAADLSEEEVSDEEKSEPLTRQTDSSDENSESQEDEISNISDDNVPLATWSLKQNHFVLFGVIGVAALAALGGCMIVIGKKKTK